MKTSKKRKIQNSTQVQTKLMKSGARHRIGEKKPLAIGDV